MSGKDSETEKKYKILHSDRVGRYMVANKDLEAGEEFLLESAFVVGPKVSTNPLCLSCYAPWPPAEDTKPLCSKCRWPVCDSTCENDPRHKDYECAVFAAVREAFNLEVPRENLENGAPQFECIMPLRLLLESEKSPDKWFDEVKEMEAHNEERSKKNQWKIDHVNVVKYLRERLKLDRFSETDVQTALGILEINCHEIRTAKGYEARALYPIMSMMNHSCVSNTSHSISIPDYKVHLRVAVKVPAGGELYGSYTYSFFPTMIRRENLLESRHFACACPRCSDPSELGSHVSSLKCNQCDNGVVMSLDSLDPESRWKCTHCEYSTSGPAVMKILKIIQAEVDAVEALSGVEGPDSIQARETLIKKYHSIFHPHHGFLTIIRYSLCQLYGRVEDYCLDDLPDVVLEHKADICRLCLQVLDVIEPGLSRARAMILYELHAPLLLLARGEWAAGVIDNAGLKSKMIEAACILKEAIAILCLEPADSPEGQLGLAARESLVELENSLETL